MIKSSGIHIEAGSSWEHLCISGPSQSFISLRAVCRKIYKVWFLTPQCIQEQSVHALMSGLNVSGSVHLWVKGFSCKIFFLCLSRPSCYTYITESEVCERRTNQLVSAIGYIYKLWFCRIFIIKIAILKNLAMIKYNSCSFRQMVSKCYISCKILSEIQYCFAKRCIDHFFYLHILHLHYRKAVSCNQLSFCLCENCLFR